MLATHVDLLGIGVNPLIVVLLIPLSIIIPLFVLRIVYQRKKYKCTECEQVFRPTFMKTNMVHQNYTEGMDQYCPKCQKMTWCKFYEE